MPDDPINLDEVTAPGWLWGERCKEIMPWLQAHYDPELMPPLLTFDKDGEGRVVYAWDFDLPADDPRAVWMREAGYARGPRIMTLPEAIFGVAYATHLQDQIHSHLEDEKRRRGLE